MNEIREFLQAANLKKLARDTGVARSTLQRIKSGQTGKMSAGTLYLLQQAMVRDRMRK